MPIAYLIKKTKTDNQIFRQQCLAVKKGQTWTLIHPDNNHELVKNVSTDFLKNEIQTGRLFIEKGWDC